jgi:DNA anti-recombination protein RmuC
VLAVIRQAVEQTQLQRTSDEILACLSAFEQQWYRFAEALDKVGRSLDSVRRSWDDLSGVRRRQLERHLDRVGELRTRREADRELGPAASAAGGQVGAVLVDPGEPGLGDAEARRRAAGDVRPLPSPPASAAG